MMWRKSFMGKNLAAGKNLSAQNKKPISRALRGIWQGICCADQLLCIPVHNWRNFPDPDTFDQESQKKGLLDRSIKINSLLK